MNADQQQLVSPAAVVDVIQRTAALLKEPEAHRNILVQETQDDVIDKALSRDQRGSTAAPAQSSLGGSTCTIGLLLVGLNSSWL